MNWFHGLHPDLEHEDFVSNSPRDSHTSERSSEAEDEMSTWKLKRVRQCAKCPWKVSTDPHEIPNGYSEDLHRGLSCTIADPGSLRGGSMMACHEHEPGEEAHCVGWLVNQLGPGNNIGLRMKMLSCENGRAIQLDGEQHERFEDTLP